MFMALHYSSLISLVPSVLLILLHLIHVDASARYGGCYFNALYNFGDSFSDTGNLAHENPLGLIYTRYPYGLTIHKATGRPSDGLLMIDYIALALGLPLLPPYLNKNASFDHGVNFAIAGAAALDSSFFLSKNISGLFTNSSLGVQLHWFNHYKSSLCSSKRDCAKKFKRSLFFIGEIGVNDLNYALLGGRISTEEWRTTYLPLVINQTIYVTKEVIKAGARHVVIPGIVPLGCTPMYLTLVGTNVTEDYDENKCLIAYNALPRLYNAYLNKVIYRLRKQHPHVDILYADFYGGFIQLLKKPKLYGFDRRISRKACCGVGGQYNYDFARLCGTPEATVCRKPTKYISWDGIHLTQEAYKVAAREVLSHGLVGPRNESWNWWKCA